MSETAVSSMATAPEAAAADPDRTEGAPADERTDRHAAATRAQPKRRLPAGWTLAVGLVLLAGTYLRLAFLTRAQWRNDEEIIWLHALRAVAARSFPWYGIPSDLGVDNGPAQLLPVLAGVLAGSPYVAYVLVAFLNVLAVAALFRLGRLWYGPAVGLGAAALCAVAPWAVIDSRRLWGNDMLVPFAVLFVTALWRFAMAGRSRRLVEAALWLAIVVQLYIAALVQLVVLAVGLVLGRRHLRPRAALLALAVFLALTAGYIVTSLGPDLASLTHAIRDTRPATPNPVGLPNWAGFPAFLQTLASDGYQFYFPQVATTLDATHGLAGAAGTLAQALFLVGIAALLWQLIAYRWRPRRGAANERYGRMVAAALLLTWVLVMPVALVVHDAPVCACFLLPSYPAQYLVVVVGAAAVGALLALSARAAISRVRHISRRALDTSASRLLSLGLPAVLLALVVVPQAGVAGPFFARADEFWPGTQYGLPYVWHQRIVAAVAAAWQPGTPIVVAGHGELDGVLRDEIATRLPGADARIVDDQHWLTAPGPGQPPMLVLLTPLENPSPDVQATPAHAALERLLAADPAMLQDAVTVPGANESFRVLRLSAADADRLATLLAAGATVSRPDVRLANDAHLDEALLPARLFPGQPAPVVLGWTILRTNPYIPSDSYYVHLLAGGHTTAALDTAFLPPGLWRQGERLWTFGSIADSGAAATPLRTIEAGLYVLRGKEASAGVTPLPMNGADGHSLTVLSLGLLAVRPAAAAPPATAALATLAPGLRLLRVEAPPTAGPGDALTVTLQWQAASAPLSRYTVFVHLLNADGALAAQDDAEPDGGQFPTFTWLPNETVTDTHALHLPAGLPPGAYTLDVGVYPTGQPDAARDLAPAQRPRLEVAAG